jgi:four helix bundle protein
MGRFLQIAMGSASELEYHCDLSLLSGRDYERLTAEVVEVKRMLASLMHRLRADS